MNAALRGLQFFLRKTRLLSRFHHILNRLHPTFDSLHPENLIATFRALQSAPTGDYYEFGIYKGFCLWFATQIADALGKKDIKFFGFDSFDGLPEPKGVDRDLDTNGNTQARGCFSAGLQLVQGFLKQHGADMTDVVLIPGFFDDVLQPSLLSEHQMGPAAVILIDCDLYESTRTVLNFIPNILQLGTIILFDDWLLYDKNKGQQLACREWLQQNPGIKMDDFCEFSGGKGFRVIALPKP